MLAQRRMSIQGLHFCSCLLIGPASEADRLQMLSDWEQCQIVICTQRRIFTEKSE
jgi:hypothetical protein